MREQLQHAFDLYHFHRRAHQISRESIKDLYEPVVAYRHVRDCFHSSAPDVKIQGKGGIFKSLYFKQCHGVYVNSLGEQLDERGLTEEPFDAGMLKDEQITVAMKNIEARIEGGEATTEYLAKFCWQWSRK